MDENKSLFCEIMDKNELHSLQQEFSNIAGVATVSLDNQGTVIGSHDGLGLPANWPEVVTGSPEATQLLEDVGEGSLEDVSMGTVSLEGTMYQMASMAIRGEQEVLLYWLVVTSSDEAEVKFWEKLDLLRDTSAAIVTNRLMRVSAQMESNRNHTAEAQMSQTIHTLEATTAIVQLLDNASSAEQVMQQWLTIVGEYLRVENGEIFRINDDGQTMDVLGEYHSLGDISVFNKKSGIETQSFLLSETPIVWSTDALKKNPIPELDELGVQAIMIFPLLRRGDGHGNMVLALTHRKAYTWSREEVKFCADAARVLQTILVGRISKNSVTSSFRALEEILNNVGASVYLTRRHSREVIFVNRMLTTTFPKEWQDGSLQRMVEEGDFGEPDSGSFEIFHADRGRWYDLIYKQVEWVDGSDAMLYSLYDITDRKLYQRKIEQQAFTDFLTGLYNRMCCERDIARMIDEARKKDTKGALVYLDLDDFKHINDGLGHQYGDVLLKSISGALKEIDGIQSTCYRMGGDEFIILISPSSFYRFEEIISEIKGVFSRPWYLKDTDYYCTSSIGVVVFPDQDDTVQDLIKKADIAMYEAKKSGKNRMARYSEGQASASGRRLDMEKNMRDAESSDYQEFEVYYQPIIDVEGGTGNEKCVGAEALVRWNSTRLGFISPSDFIPLAEYLGLINPIGNHVLRKACETCKGWNDKGYDYMKVNVNLSVVQLLQSDIVELVEEVLKETGISPRNLCLEVTESLAINDMPRMLGILTRIKSLGVSIALDDFGTGYSSLNHIREIPFDIIKVDQSFVKDLADDAYSQSFVKMVAELATTIGVKICVEGIETQAQYDVVTNFAVKYIQGYHFDKPMRQADFEKKYIIGGQS